MKVEALLLDAQDCKDQVGADELRSILKKAFNDTKALGHLWFANDEAYMEGDKPFVRVEMNRVISPNYITMIRPEVRNGEFVVVVTTNHMLDGLGMDSKSWRVAEDLDELIDDVDDMETISSVASRAKELAIAQHAKLIETVGIAAEQALRTAKKSW